MNNAESPAKSKTLSQQLSEGRLPVQDGLRYAALLAEALRKIHDDGRAHGGVTPEVIAVDEGNLELLPASPSAPRVTPYTAPEVAAQNRTADARSDIFSFGAILYEMLTGRRAFVGEPEAVLVASLCNSVAAPTGSPAVDRLCGGCLAKDPAARWQRMQKIILELKLLTAAVKRTATQPAARRDPAAEAALRTEMHQIESRLAARMQAHMEATAQAHQSIATDLRGEFSNAGDQLSARLQAQEQSNAQMHQAVGDALNNLRGQFSTAGEQLAVRMQAQEETAVHSHQAIVDTLNSLRGEFASHNEQLASRLQAQEQAVGSAHQSIGETVNNLHNEFTSHNEQLALRLQSQEQAIAGAHHAIGETVNNLRNEFVSHNEQVASRLQAQEQVVAGAQHAIGESMNNLRNDFAAHSDHVSVRLQAQEQATAQAHQAFGDAVNGLRGEFSEAGQQLSARLQAHEETSAQAQSAMHETVSSLKSQLETVSEQLAAAQEKLNQAAAASEIANLHQHLGGINERMEKLEHAANEDAPSPAIEASIEALKKQITELHTNVAADMHEFELNMKAQANAIESARTAMAQTDDLVERVVEALESLQSTVLEHADERSMALN